MVVVVSVKVWTYYRRLLEAGAQMDMTSTRVSLHEIVQEFGSDHNFMQLLCVESLWHQRICMACRRQA
jgi:hypothetical protein